MKREILCHRCYENIKKIFKSYPGEHIKSYHGKTKNNYLCDQCGEKINLNSDAVALSIWADYGGIPYYPWEDEYLLSNDRAPDPNPTKSDKRRHTMQSPPERA